MKVSTPATTDPSVGFTTPVRGHAFAAAPPRAATLRPDVGIELVREPGNPADPHAVAVWAEGGDGVAWRIGYLDLVVAARLAPRLDAGQHPTVRLAGWLAEPHGRWFRPAIRIEPPAAPRPAATAQQPATAEPSATVAPAAAAEDAGAYRVAADRGGGAPGAARRASGPRGSAPEVWGRLPGVRRRTVRSTDR